MPSPHLLAGEAAAGGLPALWFVLVAAMLGVYVLLDGFDLGAGAVHRLVARTEAERRLVLRSIGPVWDGNEVWLVAGGATLLLAFPGLYATGVGGFYLPVILLLWLLVLRAAAVELRNQVENGVWRPFWDTVFMGSSALLAFVFGLAIGNVVRGVPFDPQGRFFVPFWTHFGARGETGVLDWFTIPVGLLSLAALALHGSLWVAVKTEGPPEERARRLARRLVLPVALLTALVTALAFAVQPQISRGLAERPWTAVFPALAVLGLLAAGRSARRGADRSAFLGSSLYLAGMLASALSGIYPLVLPSSTDPGLGLTAARAAAGAHGLRVALVWWIPGILLAAGMTAFVYRRFAGKVQLEDEGY